MTDYYVSTQLGPDTWTVGSSGNGGTSKTDAYDSLLSIPSNPGGGTHNIYINGIVPNDGHGFEFPASRIMTVTATTPNVDTIIFTGTANGFYVNGGSLTTIGVRLDYTAMTGGHCIRGSASNTSTILLNGGGFYGNSGAPSPTYPYRVNSPTALGENNITITGGFEFDLGQRPARFNEGQIGSLDLDDIVFAQTYDYLSGLGLIDWQGVAGSTVRAGKMRGSINVPAALSNHIGVRLSGCVIDGTTSDIDFSMGLAGTDTAIAMQITAEAGGATTSGDFTGGSLTLGNNNIGGAGLQVGDDATTILPIGPITFADSIKAITGPVDITAATIHLLTISDCNNVTVTGGSLEKGGYGSVTKNATDCSVTGITVTDMARNYLLTKSSSDCIQSNNTLAANDPLANGNPITNSEEPAGRVSTGSIFHDNDFQAAAGVDMTAAGLSGSQGAVISGSTSDGDWNGNNYGAVSGWDATPFKYDNTNYYSLADWNTTFSNTNATNETLDVAGAAPTLTTPYSNQTLTLQDVMNFDVTTVWSGATSYTINGLTYLLEDVNDAIVGAIIDSGTRNFSIVAHNEFGNNSDSFYLQVLSGLPNKVRG